MRYIFQEEKIDTVIHCAAQSHVGTLYKMLISRPNNYGVSEYLHFSV